MRFTRAGRTMPLLRRERPQLGQACDKDIPVRNSIDFTSWQGVVSTLLGLVVVSLVAVGIRLLVMHGVQQRRERQNRQINERLKTLIAAYKTLGGSFTGDLAVDPSHLRELRLKAEASALDGTETPVTAQEGAARRDTPGSDRRRRIRDAVEAALSDVILLGTQEQVRLAVRAAGDMVAGRAVETAELVVSLRTFIREVLDLDSLPAELVVPKQGPVRAGGTAARGGRSGRTGGGGGGRGGAGQGGGDGLEGMAVHGESAFDPAGRSDHSAGA